MKDKIKELEERIKKLEEKQTQPIYYYPPVYIQPTAPVYRCPTCGSTGGCMHITC